MKHYVSLLIIFLTLFAFSQDKNASENDSIISWNNERALQWSDFQGKLNPEVFAFAVTSYKIEIIPEHVIVDQDDNIQNYDVLNVVTNFYKYHSWTVSTDNDLLKHEQLHFDIAELFARKIRKRFSELKSTNEKGFSTYWKAYNTLWIACRKLQKQYDAETNHGVKKVENLKWIEKIIHDLDTLKHFST